MKSLHVFKKARQYLDRQISLAELEDWIVPRLVLFASSEPDVARELAGAVELGLAEMSEEQISEEEFRRLLHEFLESRTEVTAKERSDSRLG